MRIHLAAFAFLACACASQGTSDFAAAVVASLAPAAVSDDPAPELVDETADDSSGPGSEPALPGQEGWLADLGLQGAEWRMVAGVVTAPSVQPFAGADPAEGKLEGVGAGRDTPKVEHRQTGPNRWSLALKSFEGVQATQREANWCWAACLQMVNAYRKVRGADGRRFRDQAEIVAYFKGGEVDEAGGVLLLMRGLNPDYEQAFRARLASAGVLAPDQRSDRMLLALEKGEPPIAGLLRDGVRHAYVVVGAEYGWVRNDNLLADVQRIVRVADDIPLPGKRKSDCQRLKEGLERTTPLHGNALGLHNVTLYDPAAGCTVVVDGAEFKQQCLVLLAPSAAKEALKTMIERKTPQVDVLKGLSSLQRQGARSPGR